MRVDHALDVGTTTLVDDIGNFVVRSVVRFFALPCFEWRLVRIVHLVVDDGLVTRRRRARGAKRRDFDDLATKENVREPKSSTDQSTIAEQAPHVLGSCVGRDVEIFRLDRKSTRLNSSHT